MSVLATMVSPEPSSVTVSMLSWANFYICMSTAPCDSISRYRGSGLTSFSLFDLNSGGSLSFFLGMSTNFFF